eukprot:TRINITY_DN13935_c0_g1_i1.p1 TRINITY_DN13935_c0_g1~~TRINITY_DN13935_c0_g1_i1.p1  ORF type:complete len:834 (-),score=174.41 TRINITY_DN13935_c0_g1_i1:709-3210(-)
MTSSVDTAKISNGTAKTDIEPGIDTEALSNAFGLRKRNTRVHSSIRHDVIQTYLQDGALDGHHGILTTLFDRCSPTGHWIDSNQATTIVCCLIVVNAAIVAMPKEAMSTEVNIFGMEPSIEAVIETTYWLLFTIELGLRLRSQRWTFLHNSWNYFDTVLFALSTVDIILNLVLGNSADMYLYSGLRLLRLLRLCRLLRFVGKLNAIMKGIVIALRALVWSMLLLLTFVYTGAIFATKFIGEWSENSDTRKLFGTVVRSMFTLFSFVTLEGWPDTTWHLIETEPHGPLIAVCIIFFILLTNIALLNLVTATMVENLVRLTDEDMERKMEDVQIQKVVDARRLEALFMGLDESGDGILTYTEFREAIRDNPAVRKEFARLGLEITSDDVLEIFHLFDYDDSGTVSLTEFIDGALVLRLGHSTARQVLGLQHDLHKMWNFLGNEQDVLRDLLIECAPPRGPAPKLGMPAPKPTTWASWAEEARDLLLHQLKQMEERAEARMAATELKLCGQVQGQLQAVEASLMRGHERIIETVEGMDLRWGIETVARVDEACRDSQRRMSADVATLYAESEKRLERGILDTIEAHSRDAGGPSAESEPVLATIVEVQKQLFMAVNAIEGRLDDIAVTAQAPTLPCPYDRLQSLPLDERHDDIADDHMSLMSITLKPPPPTSTFNEDPHKDPHTQSLQRLQLLNNRLDQMEVTSRPDRASFTPRSRQASPRNHCELDNSPLCDRPSPRMAGVVEESAFDLQRAVTAADVHGAPSASSAELHVESLAMLVGPPDSFGRDGRRVLALSAWLQRRGEHRGPFDKLILSLDAQRIELSISEQEMLRRLLQ